MTTEIVRYNNNNNNIYVFMTRCYFFRFILSSLFFVPPNVPLDLTDEGTFVLYYHTAKQVPNNTDQPCIHVVYRVPIGIPADA